MTPNRFKENFAESEKILKKIFEDESFLKSCEQFSQLLIETFEKGGTVFVCGNGGSHCEALHFAEEFTGRFRKDRKPLAALALGEASHMTCVGNDYGFEEIFSRQVEALGRKGDLLVGLSTSGNSKNVLKAVAAAKAKGLKTAALLGYEGGEIKKQVDVPVVVPYSSTDRIQEIHMLVIHTTIEICERKLFPSNY
jgi:D-sedoheptulose 7-phosphate isomerase